MAPRGYDAPETVNAIQDGIAGRLPLSHPHFQQMALLGHRLFDAVPMRGARSLRASGAVAGIAVPCIGALNMRGGNRRD
jgi:hypothetical protein